MGLLMRLLWAAVVVLPALEASAGVVFTTIHFFNGTNDGANPFAALVQGSDGNFYGTTEHGGTNYAGTVFKISSNGAFTSLYSFTGTNDGANPQAGLVQGSDGNFYGTTEHGGTNSVGSVFKISTHGALTSLYSFTGGNDGAFPNGLVQGSDGNFYGTTAGGGTNSVGTVFKISTNEVLTSLYSFTGGNDGAFPNGLVQGSDGNFYGTAAGGGTNSVGTVFKISTNGVFTSLYSFSGTNDGANPWAGLVQGGDGNFYGTTIIGGNGNGTVFKISTHGALTSLYSFTGGDDGALPHAGLVQGRDGSFYGTTPFNYRGANQGGNDDGIVFKISTNGALTSLYSFSFRGSADGAQPHAGLVQGSDGSFYGTTSYGGVGGDGGAGTVFRLTIVPEPPQLTITPSGPNVSLSWPTNATSFYLQRTVNLGATGGWVRYNIATPPVIVNGQFVVTLPITDSQPLFYRLSQ